MRKPKSKFDAILIRLCYSRRSFAAASGLPLNSVQRWCNGTVPQASKQREIASALKMAPAELSVAAGWASGDEGLPNRLIEVDAALAAKISRRSRPQLNRPGGESNPGSKVRGRA